ncbi:MAG: AAA family ATPase [Gemmataceae bacterium]
MIPQRIRLKGFLCYKDEQEITFDSNATLWMLSGLNGSGKSSIFDAVTYALFGHHRGGSQHAIELINKDSDGLAVEFEFRLDTQVYRVRRTLKKTARGSANSTQQIYRFEVNGGKHDWTAVEGSNYKTDFNNWINDKIGLTYETFTSSVLLLQGKADKLLDSKPEGRRAVLASIVDLERYERLHAKADEQRKALKGQFELLKDRLAALPQVAPEQLTEVQERIHIAASAREAARVEVERLRDLEQQAKGWLQLQRQLATAQQRWERAKLLLAEAAGIERDVERLRELRDVLPRWKDTIRLRGEIHAADLKSKSLTLEKQKAMDLLAQRDSAFKQEIDKRQTLQTLIAAEEIQQRELNAQLLAITGQMEKLKEYERHAAELARIQEELAPLPSDGASEVGRAREQLEALIALGQLAPRLARFQSSRDELRQTQARATSAESQRNEVESKGKQWSEDVKRLEPQAAEADTATRQASARATEAKTLLQQARESLKEITTLDLSGRCRHCGQALTADHLEDEKRRRNDAVQRADTQLKKANTEAQTAQKLEKEVRERLTAAQKAYQEARVEYRDCLNQVQQARTDVARLQGDCLQIFGELPESYRRRIAVDVPDDWTTSEYPTQRDLDALRAEAAGSAAARQRLQTAEKLERQWNLLKAREAATLTTLTRLQGELPSDRDSVRRQHNDLTLRNGVLDRELKMKRSARLVADKDIERLTKEREHAKAKANECDHQMKEQDLVRQHARQSVATNLKALPGDWPSRAEALGLTEWNDHDKERKDLEDAGTDQRDKELQHARLNLDVLRQDKEALATRQDDFPPAARRDSGDIKAELETAKQTEAQREKDAAEAGKQLALLEDYRKQREHVGEEYVRVEGEWNYQRTLAELLGKDRLQLYLVRQAEKQVVEYANAVLDRLSGGQLYLKLSGEANGEGNSERALDLEAYNRGTGEKAINVAFLSGSQKFRVAVSLALGIGQYASRQHRPIESVIIDEGFGCLDSQGRQVMIQELQNLRSQMRCILLVSHQEEFAEAFSDGYHFELESGATRVTRVQK